MEVTAHTDSERTCVGCRQVAPRDALLRFARGPDGDLAPDPARRLGGRGASVHPTRACIEAAVKRGGFARAFHAEITADAATLAARAADWERRRIEGLILAAHRSKCAALGTDAVRAAVADRSAVALVVAADAAGRREELVEATRGLGGACWVIGTKASLGRLFGRDELGVLAVLDERIAEEIGRASARLRDLEEEV